MTKVAFEKIKAGLEDARAWIAGGDSRGVTVHPSDYDALARVAVEGLKPWHRTNSNRFKGN